MPSRSSRSTVQPFPRSGRLLPALAAGLAVVLAALAAAPPAAAGNPGRTQFGGRAAGQAGAFTARASDPSAIHYNPAGIAKLDGLQLQAGLDFSNATDEYASAAGTFPANHTIQFPPSAYLTYRLPGSWEPVVLGVGVDTPYWYSVDFDPVGFPGRFTTRDVYLRLGALHTTAAYEYDERWSFGGSLRYLYGELEQGQNVAGVLTGGPVDVPFETEATADADVSAFTFDAGVHYATNLWGWGAVYRHGAELNERDAFRVTVRDITDPSRRDEIERNFQDLSAFQSFELPWELVGGAWIAPYPELRVELDLALTAWSALGETDIIVGQPFLPGSGGGAFQRRVRDWDDVLSVRLGVEGDLTDRWQLAGGVALEPSPVPDSTLEPGFPRGDALVYALGVSYELSWISFDLGYSFWDYDDRPTTGQELRAPNRPGTFSARESVWSASARWRL